MSRRETMIALAGTFGQCASQCTQSAAFDEERVARLRRIARILDRLTKGRRLSTWRNRARRLYAEMLEVARQPSQPLESSLWATP